ncbi:PilZ domain-containing protein [Cycloclasticus sp.]|jgi:hypothetical protein|uniref:PilZ domain-containing protein n=1 Tax=Cycloclasticus sp. TaxID=2024830 RepID=UPI000C0D16C5|nr:PilZ domain-containing protein [Cycloclasticus sp.]PHR50900.1 MAG: hypothetical protein COA48_05475 [Cycloclasticus sp.]|tara:strand:+ start:212 stop:949 length:738 start_codon:yes stop_codon:yes gene_type:complete
MNKKTADRRHDKRLYLPDLQIKVRPHGLSNNVDYTECTPVDVSLNGLAFSSKDLRLELLQKVDIRFSVGHKMIEGSAVICHIESQPLGMRYGVLYLDIHPSIEESFSLGALSSSLVKNLAINMADNAVINSRSAGDAALLRKGQILLFDAVESFRDRLSDLLAKTIDEEESSARLGGLFEFSLDTYSVTVPLRGQKDDLLRRIITPILIKSQVVYEADNGVKFISIIEVLQELSDTFEWILSEQN